MTPNARSAIAARPYAVTWSAAPVRPAPASVASARVPVVVVVPESAAAEGARLGRAVIPNPNAAHPGACPARAACGHPSVGNVPPGPAAVVHAHLGCAAPLNAPLPEPRAPALLAVAHAALPNAVSGTAQPLDDVSADVRLPHSVSLSAASVHVACALYLPYTGFYGICPVLAMVRLCWKTGWDEGQPLFHPASQHHERLGDGKMVPAPQQSGLVSMHQRINLHTA